MYGNDLILTNVSEFDQTYHIAKGETLKVPISSLTVNGQEVLYRMEAGLLLLNLHVPASASVEIIIHYAS